MANFFTQTIPNWWARFKGAFWDATKYFWDDAAATWDAWGKDSWENDNPTPYQTKNKPAFKTDDPHTWFTKQ